MWTERVFDIYIRTALITCLWAHRIGIGTYHIRLQAYHPYVYGPTIGPALYVYVITIGPALNVYGPTIEPAFYVY
jgi:hypothetical protein